VCKHIFKSTILPLSILLAILTASVVFSAWTEPTSLPPDGNVSPPINISDTGQTKTGYLMLQGAIYAPIFYDKTDTSYYINPGGQSIFEGPIGIGTSTPAYKIDVWGGARFSDPIIVGAPTADYHATTRSYVDSAVAGAAGLWSASSTDIYFDTGNVGIGTTDPGYKLNVFGSGNIVLFGNATDGILLYNSAGVGGIVGYDGSGHNDVDIRSTIGIGSQLYLKTDGNVGIGTTVPGYKLDVQGTGRFTDPVIVGTPTADTHATTKSYVDSIIVGGVGETVGYWTQSGTDIYNSNSGSVGIGTTTIGARLTLQTSGTTDILNLIETGGTEVFTVLESGNVGIGTTVPGYKLDVQGTGYFANPVIVGTPTVDTHAATKSYVDSAVTTGTASDSKACSADATCEMLGADLQGGDITGVDKLTVTTIDPLYEFDGIEYSTYVASMSGGVKEEYTGMAELSNTAQCQNSHCEYEYVIDFNNTVLKGSDLWLWRKVVDFSKQRVQVIITPYGASADIYYFIEGNKIIFRGDKQVEFSYRLTGNRYDWRQWPTTP